ncbi:MAG: DUF4105 domain-containing protein, partial [SAR324 cluster bacterium]|nr:DUF4105 domain-containing protein [SAR324 cluster bacterium]
ASARSFPVHTARQIGELAYLNELFEKARKVQLWEARLWWLLLHYGDDWLLGGVTSEADGPGFFNAPNGKTNPQPELEATLARFFSTAILEPGKQTAQCTFPARYHWLKSRLGFDSNRLPELDCPRFERWRRNLDAGSVSLVFASYYLNNPASMFGHTFLVLNKKGRPASERMLSYVISFGALVPEDQAQALLFAVKGLTGQYQGHFSALPYYVKLREYTDIESRDIWEYELRFTQAQLDRLVRHAWEMGSTYFDYYFLKENCSYHLLSLLEVADPRLDLRKDYNVWTIPVETIRQMLALPGMVVKTVYRPSRGSLLRRKLGKLEGDETNLVQELTGDPAMGFSGAFEDLPTVRKILVLDTAVDFYQYRIAAARGEGDRELKSSLRRLLLRRSRLGIASGEPQAQEQGTPPHLGHRSQRWAVAAGEANGESQFLDLTWQAAFHQLMSRDEGYSENSQINGFLIRLRHDSDASRTKLEQFSPVDIISLAPLSTLNRLPSWKINAGWRRARDGACGGCLPFTVNGGIGLALRSQLLSREVYFGFVELTMDFESDFDKGFRAGLGASLGIMVDVVDAWRIALIGGSTEYSEGQQGTVEKAEFRQRFSLGTDLELNIDFAWQNDYREGTVGLGYYF